MTWQYVSGSFVYSRLCSSLHVDGGVLSAGAVIEEGYSVMSMVFMNWSCFCVFLHFKHYLEALILLPSSY